MLTVVSKCHQSCGTQLYTTEVVQHGVCVCVCAHTHFMVLHSVSYWFFLFEEKSGFTNVQSFSADYVKQTGIACLCYDFQCELFSSDCASLCKVTTVLQTEFVFSHSGDASILLLGNYAKC